MKISLNWVFDHIDCNISQVDIENLVNEITSKVVEVERVIKINQKLDNLFIAEVESVVNDNIKLHIPELKTTIDIKNSNKNRINVNELYLVLKDGSIFRFANLQDLGSEKDSLICKLYIPERDNFKKIISGYWKNEFETKDYILDISNHTITNRPDLWGHRGFAREIASLLNKELISEDIFLASKTIKHYISQSPITSDNPFKTKIEEDANKIQGCTRLSSLYISNIENRGSSLWMLIRLARIDSKPINFLVDTTNYVMFDISQPMHVFDAHKIVSKQIIAKYANNGDKLELIDGSIVSLTDNDYIISDGIKPISLAGIIGGADSAIDDSSNSILIESGNFNPILIRKTSNRLKKRSEASTRFEKTLDPNQNTNAILRYLKILQEENIKYKSADSIVSIGSLMQEQIIEVRHNLILSKIGSVISPSFIEETLIKLGFGFQAKYENDEIIYLITVPTYRGTKDITIAEDIIEEIARYVGYNSISLEYPKRDMKPFNTKIVYRERDIKRHLAYSMRMHEISSYAFFDDEFLSLINFEPKNNIFVVNPQSINYNKLVSSLVPNLLKVLYINQHKADELRFFELARVWFENYEKERDKYIAIEAKELSGVFLDKKGLDFYQAKCEVDSIFKMLSIKVEWKKQDKTIFYDLNRSADIYYDDVIIAKAGILDKKITKNLFDYDVFAFEINGDFLLNCPQGYTNYVSLSKYQDTDIDISIIASNQISTYDIENIIKNVDNRIKTVFLIDFYQNKDFNINAERSLTFRINIQDDKKTLTKDDINSIINNIKNRVESIGTKVR